VRGDKRWDAMGLARDCDLQVWRLRRPTSEEARRRGLGSRERMGSQRSPQALGAGRVSVGLRSTGRASKTSGRRLVRYTMYSLHHLGGAWVRMGAGTAVVKKAIPRTCRCSPGPSILTPAEPKASLRNVDRGADWPITILHGRGALDRQIPEWCRRRAAPNEGAARDPRVAPV